MTTEGTLITSEAITVEYGGTFNLGDYNNEKIRIRITVGPDETLEAAAARARAFVEGMHEETVARRKRAAAIEQAQSRIRDLDYWIERNRKEAASLGLIVTYETPALVESDDELERLHYQVAVREAEQKAIRTATDDYREQKWRAQTAMVGTVHDDEDLDGSDDDDEG